MGSNRKDSWDLRFVQLADTVASWSKDPSTKVGAVIVRPSNLAVVAQGFNGFPRGVRDNTHLTKRYARPDKYWFTEHAERNAIFNAAYLGHRTEGCILYMNWAPTEICADCARAIIQAGIEMVIGPPKEMRKRHKTDDSWHSSLQVSAVMFAEAGVGVFTALEPIREALPNGF